jgi:hypothetical protein
MHYSDMSRTVLGAARRHPWRAVLAVCVPGAVVVASVITSTTMASAQPAVTLAIPAAASTAAPGAHIIPDAAQSLATPVQDVKSGAVEVKVPINMSGCDANYGTPNQCIPLTIPGSTPAAKCAWLKSMGFGVLQITRANDQGLPENAEGYVCATGA